MILNRDNVVLFVQYDGDYIQTLKPQQINSDNGLKYELFHIYDRQPKKPSKSQCCHAAWSLPSRSCSPLPSPLSCTLSVTSMIDSEGWSPRRELREEASLPGYEGRDLG